MTEAKISPKKIPIEDWVKAVKKIEVPDFKEDEKKIFDAVKAHKNIPKTSSKFNNFCIHNLKVKNEKLINKMWNHLSSALEQQSGPAKETIETKKVKLDKKLAPKKSEAKSDVKKVSFSNNGSPDESKASKKAGSKAKVHEPTPRKLPDAKAAKLEAIKAAKKQKKQKVQQKKEDDGDSDDAVDEEPVAKKSTAKNGLQKGTKGPQKAAAPVKGAFKSALKKDDQTNNSKVNSQKNKKNQVAKKEAAPTKNGLSEVSKKKAEAKTKGAKPALKTTGKNPKLDPKKKKKQAEEDDDDDDDDDDDEDIDLDSDDDIDFSDSDAISMDDEAMDSVSSGSDENEDEESDDDELLSFDEDDSIDESEEDDEDE